jgi:hypothetical protein
MITETLAQGVVTITSTESGWDTSPLDDTLVSFVSWSSRVEGVQVKHSNNLLTKKFNFPMACVHVWPTFTSTALQAGGATIFTTAL